LKRRRKAAFFVRAGKGRAGKGRAGKGPAGDLAALQGYWHQRRPADPTIPGDAADLNIMG